MTIKTEEMTRCYLNNEELMILCEARDLVCGIRLAIEDKKFNNYWDNLRLYKLHSDINHLFNSACMEVKHEQKF